jgi:chromosome segregation ATPase
MTTKTFLRNFAVGLIIGLLIFPPLPAQAQWMVFDPTAYSQRVKSELRRIREWVNEIQWYQELYTTSVQQLTTLQGVLKTVDKQLFKNKELALLANDIGKILNDSQQLRRRLESMVRYQIRSLQSIDDRLEQGIFDPDADLRDMQNYLLYTMGRDARQTVDQMMRAARADAQLAKWIDERKKLCEEVSILSQDLDKTRAMLKKEQLISSTDDPRNIQQLNDTIAQLEKQIADLWKQIKELTEKIAQRAKEHGLRLEDMENFAHEVDTTNEMWKELQKTKGDLQKTLDGLILGASPPTTD